MKPEDNDEAVPIALAVIEHTLQFLSEGGEAENDGEDEAATVKSEGLRKWVDMDPQRLLQLKRDLDEAVDAMFIYLEDLREAGSLNDALVLPICRSQISPSCPARWLLYLYSAATAVAHCTQSCICTPYAMYAWHGYLYQYQRARLHACFCARACLIRVHPCDV